MKRGILLIGLALMVFSPFRLAHAQQAGKVPRIGFLGTTSPSAISARVEGFRQGLRENGYIEGQNIAIEYRWAEGKRENPKSKIVRRFRPTCWRADRVIR